jgi:hypothetical protein
MRDSVEGAIVAPAIPSRARAAMSISALVANTAAIDDTPNAAAPNNMTRRLSMRLPSVPIVIRNRRP